MPRKKVSKNPRLFVAVKANSPLNCYPSVEAAVEGAKKWFAAQNGMSDVMIYEVVPIKRVSRVVDVAVAAPGELTIH